nr:MAG TPA: Poxvirus A3L Protein [Caudoviricetes sp.]
MPQEIPAYQLPANSYQASWLYGMKLSPRQLCSSCSTASKQNAQRKRHTY